MPEEKWRDRAESDQELAHDPKRRGEEHFLPHHEDRRAHELARDEVTRRRKLRAVRDQVQARAELELSSATARVVGQNQGRLDMEAV